MASTGLHHAGLSHPAGSVENRSGALSDLERWLGHMEEAETPALDLGGRAREPAVSSGRPRAELFEVSIRDFREQARSRGWDFWRGVLVGFAASFPFAYAAFTGTVLLRIA